jgi:hypothetical protein
MLIVLKINSHDFSYFIKIQEVKSKGAKTLIVRMQIYAIRFRFHFQCKKMTDFTHFRNFTIC